MYRLPQWTDTCNLYSIVPFPFPHLRLDAAHVPCQLFNTAQNPSVPYVRLPKGTLVRVSWGQTGSGGQLIQLSKFNTTFLEAYTVCPVHAGFPNEYVACSTVPNVTYSAPTYFTPT